MKLYFSLTTIMLQLLVFFTLDFIIAFLFWLLCLIGGLYIHYCVEKPVIIVSAGQGLLYGSLALLVFALIAVGYLSWLYS